MEQPPGRWQIVVVTRLDGFPTVGGGVGCRKTEHLGQPGLAVAAVVGERLAGPLTRDQHPATGVAEMLASVRLALAGAGDQARAGVLGLDAIPQPVRARRRARLEPQRLSEPVHMLTLEVSLGVVAVTELLGQVLSEVADAPARVLGPGEHTLGVELGPEPGHMRRVVVRADGVDGV